MMDRKREIILLQKITVKDDWKKKMNKEDKNINTSQSIIKHRKDKSVYK